MSNVLFKLLEQKWHTYKWHPIFLDHYLPKVLNFQQSEYWSLEECKSTDWTTKCLVFSPDAFFISINIVTETRFVFQLINH